MSVCSVAISEVCRITQEEQIEADTNCECECNDDNCVSPEEREKINFEVALIGKMIEARETKGLSQRELAELSGVKQPAIARMEIVIAAPPMFIVAPRGIEIE